MNDNLVSYEVAESPKKTTGVIVGVTLVVLGIGAVVLYFVRESAKADKPFSNQAERDLIRQVEQENGNISTLLDKLSNFGLNKGQSTSSSTASTSSGGTSTASITDLPENIGCNQKFKKLQDVDEDNPSSNLNKCGLGVYEFQDMLSYFGYDTKRDGRYGTATLLAHKKWLAAS